MNILEKKIIKLAFLEDQILGDVTTEAIIDLDRMGSGKLIAKEEFILAGVETFYNVFALLSPNVKIDFKKQNGDLIKEGDVFAELEGEAHILLKGERIGLNFLQHLSGVATLTKRFVDITSKYGVSLLDTRKTIPGLRVLEKKAVLAGGGKNHRFSLSDSILIKDNHIAVCGGDVASVLESVEKHVPYLGKVEIEVENLEDVSRALEKGADVIMLDNMDVADVKKAVALVNKRAFLEVSGSVTLDNIEEKAATGVDAISVGALSHSASAVDISMTIDI